MRRTVQESMQTAVDWVDREPRQAAFSNVWATALQGLLLGLSMGLFAGLVTGGFSKVWTYAANTFAVMLIRAALQWLWVLRVTPQVHRLGQYLLRKRTGQDIPEGIGQKHLGEEQVARTVVPAIVSVAIATFLATEELNPAWLNQTWAIAVIASLGGGVSSVLEALSVPTNIYAIVRNRHQYQETLSYQSGTKRNNRANRRR